MYVHPIKINFHNMFIFLLLFFVVIYQHTFLKDIYMCHHVQISQMYRCTKSYNNIYKFFVFYSIFVNNLFHIIPIYIKKHMCEYAISFIFYLCNMLFIYFNRIYIFYVCKLMIMIMIMIIKMIIMMMIVNNDNNDLKFSVFDGMYVY